jgi:hypothetical protein
MARLDGVRTYDYYDGYVGVAELTVDGTVVDVRATLRGFFHPADGRYQWYGRLSGNGLTADWPGGRRRHAVIRTAEGQATGMVSDPDYWGRYRILGFSTPPFAVTTDLPDDSEEG